MNKLSKNPLAFVGTLFVIAAAFVLYMFAVFVVDMNDFWIYVKNDTGYRTIYILSSFYMGAFSFTMVIPIPDKDATEENIQGHVSFECRHLKVAATYQPKQDSDNEMILSLDYLFSVYPTLNYEELKLKNLAKSDSHYTGELEQKLRDISKLSSKNAFYNYAEMSKEFYDRVHLQMFQLIVSISILIVMIMTALVVSSDLRIRSDLSGYAVMRAVGADIGTVRTLILDEIKRQLIVGIVGGAACGSGVCFFFAAMTSNIKTGDIFLFYVLPVLAVTILLLYCGTCAAVKKLTAVLFHRSIIEMIGFTE